MKEKINRKTMYQENLSEKCSKSYKISKRILRSTSLPKASDSKISKKKQIGSRKLERELSADQIEGRRILRSYTNKFPSYNFVELQNHDKTIKKSNIDTLKQNFDYKLHTFNYDESENDVPDTTNNSLNEISNISVSSTVSLINSSLEILNYQEFCNNLHPGYYNEDESIKNDTNVDIIVTSTKINTADINLLNETSDSDNNENSVVKIEPKENKIIKDIDCNNNNNNLLLKHNEVLNNQMHPKPLQIQYLLNSNFIPQIKLENNNNFIKLFTFSKKHIGNYTIDGNNYLYVFKTITNQLHLSNCNNNSKLMVTEMNNNNNTNNSQSSNDKTTKKINLLPDKNNIINCKVENIQTTIKSEIKKYTNYERNTMDEYKINVSNKIKMLETFGTSVSQQCKTTNSITPVADQILPVTNKFIRFKPIDNYSNSVLAGNVKINLNINHVTTNAIDSGSMQQRNKLAKYIPKAKSMTSILKTSPNKPIVNSLLKVNQIVKSDKSVASIMKTTPKKLKEKIIKQITNNKDNKGCKQDDVEHPIIDVETVDKIEKSPEFLNKEVICCKTPPTTIILNRKQGDMTETSENIYSRFFSKNSNKLNKPATICKRNTDNIAIALPNNSNNNNTDSVSSISKHIRPISKAHIKATIIPYTSTKRNKVRINNGTTNGKIFQMQRSNNKRTTLAPVAVTVPTAIRQQTQKEQLSTLEKVQILNKNYMEIKRQYDEINNENKCVCNLENYIKNYCEFSREPAFSHYLNNNNGSKYSNHRGCIAQHCSVENSGTNFKITFNKNMIETESGDLTPTKAAPAILTKIITENYNKKLVKNVDDGLEALLAMPVDKFYQTNNDDNFNIRDYLDIF